MKSGLLKQLSDGFRRFFSRRSANTGTTTSKMATLPKFDELLKSQPAKAKLPSFAELQAAQAAKKGGLPSFEELQKASKAKKDKGSAKKPKQAKTLDIFRGAISPKQPIGHALFYRYLRTQDEANEGLPGPRGGACILVNMLNEREFTFSFSVCSEEDPFIKDESRRLCQERFLALEIIKVTNRDANASCYENIYRAIENYFKNQNAATDAQLQLLSPKVTMNQLRGLKRAIHDYYLTQQL
jgi:hypothetical protein